jgi:hypothetical protein
VAVINSISRSSLSPDVRLDSSFYRPEYLRQEAAIRRRRPSPIVSMAAVTDGNHLSIAEQFVPIGIRYLRGQDLSEFFLSDSNAIYITKSLYKSLPRSHIHAGDVLVVVVGANTGSVSLVTDRFGELTANCKIAILRPFGIVPEFLAIYLASRLGQNEIRRRVRGSGQTGLILPDLREIPIPQHSDSLAKRIVSLVRKAQSIHAKAMSLYPDAQQEMLARLGWSAVEKSRPALSYTSSLSSVTAARRLDSSYFQPRYVKTLSLLAKAGCRKLRDFCAYPRKGVHPEYADSGACLVVNSKHLGPQHVDSGNLERADPVFFDLPEHQYAKLKKHDVLVYSTGAYVGRANIWLEKQPAIAGVDVTILRPDPSVCVPGFLALFLNSPPGIMLSETASIGSAQRHIYPSQLAHYPIYIPMCGTKVDITWQAALASKVEEAYWAQCKSDALIAEAKALVERETIKDTRVFVQA